MMRSGRCRAADLQNGVEAPKASSGLSLTVVPVQAVPSGTSVKRREAVRLGSGLGGLAEAEVDLVDPHPVENDAQLAG